MDNIRTTLTNEINKSPDRFSVSGITLITSSLFYFLLFQIKGDREITGDKNRPGSNDNLKSWKKRRVVTLASDRAVSFTSHIRMFCPFFLIRVDFMDLCPREKQLYFPWIDHKKRQRGIRHSLLIVW